MMILLLFILGAAVYLLVKNNGSPAFNGQTKDKAIKILKQRYVNGEIGDEEYERKLKVIKA